MAGDADRTYSDDVAARLPGRLRHLREARGLSQQELAAIIGVSRPRVAEYEAGRSLPGWAAVVRIAHALGVTPDAFIAAEKKS